MPGSDLLNNAISLSKCANIASSHGMEDILGFGQQISIGMNDVDNFTHHIGLTGNTVGYYRLGSGSR